MKIRIDKFLCDMGIGSRTEIKSYIKKKMITVNGDFVKSASDKVDSDVDTVSFNGQEIKYLEYEYFILNKPAGVISASDDKKCQTVIDLIEDIPTTNVPLQFSYAVTTELNEKVIFDVWDTAGQERFRTINILFFKNASTEAGELFYYVGIASFYKFRR